ncbi:MAG: divalent-cation tolerance protein CutA [Prosthecobacter sp.]|jgi:periplasmic divalent cation tolerance protein|uniref:divalent-cation tolerance protein CutA n=1 Tax=Prosthecobacter sp. TaxID=1965333 RepID=UPI001A070E1E|nr:divalent-cation tolerance protein CutA [Prosthecobacter sp.]MBE2285817.1 divalent-cation tolerance protein CutA [Prosthecobacter sp.]
MSDILIVLCTFPDMAKARETGTALVESQLAACVNLIPAVESIYRWEGKVETSSEVLAIFKTTPEAWPRFESRLAGLHPYDVPEIVALRPEQVANSYAQWVAASVT